MFSAHRIILAALFAAVSHVAPKGGGKPPTEKETKIEKPKADAGAEKSEEAKEKSNRSKFGDAQVITLLVDHNPKRANSASHARFENYEDGMTVKAALEAGITTGDLNWDTDHEFVKIGDTFDKAAEKKSKAVKPEKEEKAPAEKEPADSKAAASKVGGKAKK